MGFAENLMPNKDLNKILHPIEQAVNIYFKEKVSSNINIELGESDDNILDGVSKFAELGALSTLYPYNPIKGLNEFLNRTLVDQIYNLSIKHTKLCKNIM